MKIIKRGNFCIAPKLLIVLLAVFFISCSTSSNNIQSGEKYGAKSGTGNFMMVGDKTYVVNNDGELIDITGSLITEGAGSYNYTYYRSGCTNHTINQTNTTLSINKGVPTTNMNLYANNKTTP